MSVVILFWYVRPKKCESSMHNGCVLSAIDDVSTADALVPMWSGRVEYGHEVLSVEGGYILEGKEGGPCGTSPWDPPDI